ncbi:PREDICTED: homeobox protein ATH1-like isoform X1 [Nelumbo nucifera]|nr:PREDICTED: homeobox protein ATH1-like isoform X1 [Nelumbo nucifera]XP_010262197.1 PREDICTED: homeobox protein ATH1-like isoform X1 [Nelumbo nucifera]XP_010262198.1 PREDICTED: homeobox protein ATH1-like isoform X1 [Nelumbo nucifera]XP_010262199.1 PREDICTED: homeobox protein ATH1-like isoform X1 [Nelumbo nucifera]
MTGYPVPTNDVGDDLHMTNDEVVIYTSSSISRNIPFGGPGIRDSSVVSSQSIDNSEFQRQLVEGASLTAASLATLLATNGGVHEDLNGVMISSSSAFSLEDLRTFASNGCCDTSNSSLSASVNCGYNGGNDFVPYIDPKKDASMTGQLDGKWDSTKLLGPQEISAKASVRMVCQPHSFMGNLDPHVWTSSNKSNISVNNLYGYFMHGNELSLSLAMCQPSIISVPTITDQCSEISSSGIIRQSLHNGLGVGFGLENAYGKRKELSLGFGSCMPIHFSQIVSGSKYRHVAQQILSEIATYSLKNVDCMSYSTVGIGTEPKIPLSSEREVQTKVSDETEAKKAQLLALLQVVDNRYNQCLDEIHTVISAFHAATELDPQIHARFVLRTISFLYSNLRERIANQILATREHINSGCIGEEKSFESSFLQKQCALQQLRRKDHQSWRPQRGLPERSVSVLRAWMFQNFLHPYPKDAEKHLLAIRSGLTRSQVSNWFINARVRLWKPMIEEMYSEMNYRKGHRTEDGKDNDRRSQMRIDNQRMRMN